MKNFKRFIASLLIVSITAMGLPVSSAQAGIVPTDEVASTAAARAQREQVTTWLAREDVRQVLQSQGIGPQEAADRVRALSDDEVGQLAGRIDQLPAGGDAVGVILFVFVLLLITDIMGLTKVFPFTRSVR